MSCRGNPYDNARAETGPPCNEIEAEPFCMPIDTTWIVCGIYAYRNDTNAAKSDNPYNRVLTPPPAECRRARPRHAEHEGACLGRPIAYIGPPFTGERAPARGCQIASQPPLALPVQPRRPQPPQWIAGGDEYRLPAHPPRQWRRPASDAQHRCMSLPADDIAVAS